MGTAAAVAEDEVPALLVMPLVVVAVLVIVLDPLVVVVTEAVGEDPGGSEVFAFCAIWPPKGPPRGEVALPAAAASVRYPASVVLPLRVGLMMPYMPFLQCWPLFWEQ